LYTGADQGSTQWGPRPPLKFLNSPSICAYYERKMFKFCNFIEERPPVKCCVPGQILLWVRPGLYIMEHIVSCTTSPRRAHVATGAAQENP
jgi:hypothetical protein